MTNSETAAPGVTAQGGPPPVGVWAEAATLRWLAANDLPTVDFRIVKSVADAQAAFEAYGPPVVLKLADNSVLHKSDAGGVITNLVSETDVRAAYETIRARASLLLGGDVHEGVDVLIEPQLIGVEVLVGIRRDPSLGSFVVFGAGGSFAEWIDDAAVAYGPVSEKAAAELINSSRVRQLLIGFRTSLPVGEASLRALRSLVASVSEIAARHPQLLELDLNPVIVGSDGAVPVDARMVVANAESPPRRVSRPLTASLFEPKSIAVVGASRDPLKPGGRVLRYLRERGFAGEIHAVNPRAKTVQGVSAYPSLAAIPSRIDLVCIAVPSELVGKAIDDCADAGIPNAVVFSAGFGETGRSGLARGYALQRKLARPGVDLRVVGPNSNGVVSLEPPVYSAIGMAFEMTPAPAGAVALVTQSGAVGSALLSRGWDEGLGFSRWVSTGNESDITVDEYLDFLAFDDRTKIILLFLEGIRDGERFIAAAEACRREGKPLVAYKAGRSAVGRRTAGSHTGAIAGDDRLFDALLRKAGVVRVRTLRGLVDAGRVLSRYSLPCGAAVGIISMSGGVAAVLADECSTATLSLPSLPAEAELRLGSLLPAYCTITNPLDVTADAVARPELLAAAVEAMVECPAVDLVLVQLTTNAEPSASAIAKTLVGLSPVKPVLVSRLGSPRLAHDAMDIYAKAGVPVFGTPEAMVEAARSLTQTAQVLRG